MSSWRSPIKSLNYAGSILGSGFLGGKPNLRCVLLLIAGYTTFEGLKRSPTIKLVSALICSL
jgi:hypothetical protein